MKKEEENKKDEKRKRNPIINILKTEWEFLGSRRKVFVFYMFLFFIAGAVGLMATLVTGWMFNFIQQTTISDSGFRIILLLIFALLGIKIIFWIFHGTGRILEMMTGFHVHRRYTNNKISKILELPVKWHKDNHSGDTIDKINRGRDSIQNFSSYYTFDLMYILLNIFGSLIILFFVDSKIALFALILSSFILLGIISIDRRLRVYYLQLNKFSNKLGASVFDYLSNIITVITLRLKKTVVSEIDTRLTASYDTFKKSTIIDETKWAFGSIAITFMAVLALAYRAYSDYHATGIILIGTLFILYGYLRTVGDAFFEFGRLYGKATRLSARIEGVYPIDEAFEKLEGKTKGRLPDWKDVEIKNLNFTYDEEHKKNHLRDINMKFRRGQKIALVGESGSGKSTILALLRGLYPPQNGEVYCDGKKIKNGFERLKRSVTLIPQDPEIFNNTIKYNIAMDLPTRKENLQKVIEMAQFKKVVDRLEKGLDTNVLEKGVSLSGGEKQRLALARGLLAGKNSDVILMDEPTSSVDSLNEMKIHDNIFKNFKGKTIVSSIHRLHLLNKFDYIYYFERGKIIAEGSLEEIRKNYKFRYLLRKYGMRGEVK